MSNATGARPTGVTVIALLSIISGVLGALGGLAAFFGSAVINIFPSSDTAGLAGAVFVLGIIALVLGIFHIVLGIAFFGMKPWSWRAMLILTVLSIVSGLLSMDVIGLVISGIIAYYLFTAPIKKIYGATFGPSF